MCEFCNSNFRNSALDCVKSLTPDAVINSLKIEQFPYVLQPGHCPVCGKYLPEDQRKPIGKATRSMCRTDYQNLIASHINKNCFICRKPLPVEKVFGQVRNKREIKHHIHDGQCMHAWTIIHNIAVGDPQMSALFGIKEKGNMALEAIKALPPPNEQLKVEDILFYKGKPVKVISKQRG